MIKAIFFDIDGTLISTQNRQLSPATVAALKHLREQGVLLCICTGRSPATIPEALVGYFDILIALNGQYAYDAEKLYFHYCFDPADVAYLVEQAKAMHTAIYLVLEDRYFVNFHAPAVIAEAEQHNTPLAPAGDPESALGQAVYGGSVFLGEAEQAAFLAPTKALDGTRWHPEFFDLVNRGRGKHSALEEICKIYRIETGATMAFGDGENDLGMLQAAGIGVAMGNANEAVKAVADYVTAPVDEDGVVQALRHFGLLD